MRFLLLPKVRSNNPRRWREGSFRRQHTGSAGRFLRGHEVVRADELGRQGLENGALLDAAEQDAAGGFVAIARMWPFCRSLHLARGRATGEIRTQVRSSTAAFVSVR